jgi:formylglycine-generating enzyme required for sulfatase activity
MVVLEGPVTFDMGSPPDEPDRTPFEMLHHRRISRTFAIASTEVTVEQFREFIQEHEFSEKYAPEPSCPVVEVSWMDAAKYCRWLSEQEKVPEEQMCFPPIDKINLDMVLPADLLDRTGYRLPTAAEWECAARAGSLTSRHFGRGESLLGRFAWYDTNSQNRTWPVGGLLPNGMGLFDVYGNVGEWCQSWYFDEYVQGPAQSIIEDWPDQRIGVFRELRGGSFMDSPAVVRTADRDYDSPESRSYAIGFRLARTIRSVRELR